jgi:hypothetical protein
VFWGDRHKNPGQQQTRSNFEFVNLIFNTYFQVLLRLSESDPRFDFKGGKLIVEAAQINLAERNIVLPSKIFVGAGLPGCFLKNPKVTVAEVAICHESGIEVAAGMVFRDLDREGPADCFVFGGLARPTGNDLYLFFLGGNMQVKQQYEAILC